MKRERCEHAELKAQIECLAATNNTHESEVAIGFPSMKDIMGQAARHVHDKPVHDLPEALGNVLLRLNSFSCVAEGNTS